MTGYLTPFAALAALIAKAFTNYRNTRKSAHLVALFPATARATIKRSRLQQPGEAEPLCRSRVDRD